MIVVSGVTPVWETYRPIRLPAVMEALELASNLILFGVPVSMIVVFYWATRDWRLALILIGAVATAFIFRRGFLARLKHAANVRWLAAPTWWLSNTWALDDNGITITDGTFSTTISWGALTAVREERDRLVFMHGLFTGHVLPIRFLDAGRNQLGEIRDLVARIRQAGQLGAGVD